ncbi:ubiquinol-cytochrome c reductase, iron-sulfur subunit, partial [Vibrio cholerae CP1050(23)]
MSNAPLNQG